MRSIPVSLLKFVFRRLIETKFEYLTLEIHKPQHCYQDSIDHYMSLLYQLHPLNLEQIRGAFMVAAALAALSLGVLLAEIMASYCLKSRKRLNISP